MNLYQHLLILAFTCSVSFSCVKKADSTACLNQQVAGLEATKSSDLGNDVGGMAVKDVCSNYAGIQTRQQLAELGFISKENQCFLRKNHAALSRMGFDRIKIQGIDGTDEHIALLDMGGMSSYEHVLVESGAKARGVNHATQIARMIVDKKHGLAAGAYVHFFSLGNDVYRADKKDVYARVLEFLNAETETSVAVYPNTLSWNLLSQDRQLELVGQKINRSKIVHVFAAGNQAQDLSELAASGKDELNKSGALDLNNILFVGSFDVNRNQLSKHSNFPGANPRLQRRFLVGVGEALDLGGVGDDKSAIVFGTSYVAPQIASSIALLKSIDKDLSAKQAADILLQTANKNLPEYRQTCRTQFGEINCGKMVYGEGLLDIASATEMVIEKLKSRCGG